MKKVKLLLISIFIFLSVQSLNAKMVCYWQDESVITVQKDIQGRVSVWTEITTDKGKKQVRKRVDMYTYYESGEIDTITNKVYDSADKLVMKKENKHYTDGKQPSVTDKLGGE